MKKTLYLIRHAKSDWGNDTLKDIDRPLNTRGYDDAYRCGLSLKKKSIKPDLILCSPSVRTYSTALILAKELEYPLSCIQTNENIYEADENTLLEIIHAIPEKLNTVLFIGHNPGFTNLFNSISDSFVDNLPTCALMAIEWENKWEEIAKKNGRLLFHEFPKDFRT